MHIRSSINLIAGDSSESSKVSGISRSDVFFFLCSNFFCVPCMEHAAFTILTSLLKEIMFWAIK